MEIGINLYPKWPYEEVIAAFVENGRTYLPLRFVSETLGAKVEWKADEQQVIITK